MYEKLQVSMDRYDRMVRDKIDAAAEREAAAVDQHRTEHRSVFCPNHFMTGRTDQLSLAEQLGVSMAGVVSYVRRMQRG